MYANHFQQLIALGDMHLYLNELFVHLVMIGEEHNLLESSERAGLDDLLVLLLPKGANIATSSSLPAISSNSQEESSSNVPMQHSTTSFHQTTAAHKSSNTHQ